VTHNGEIIPPAPRPAPSPTPSQTPSSQTAAEPSKGLSATALTPEQKASRDVATVTAGMGTALALGKATGPVFMSNVFTFGLAGLIGYRAVWGVIPALHSPLMSVTNAISGEVRLPRAYGHHSSISQYRHGRRRRILHYGWRVFACNFSSGPRRNVSTAGVRQRIRWFYNHAAHVGHVQTYVSDDLLSPFSYVDLHSLIPGPTDPPEYPWLYAIPGLLFGGGYIAAASTGMAGLVQAGYLVSSLLCIG
jgi:H+-translocating NAD(P) transhydrogenase